MLLFTQATGNSILNKTGYAIIAQNYIDSLAGIENEMNLFEKSFTEGKLRSSELLKHVEPLIEQRNILRDKLKALEISAYILDEVAFKNSAPRNSDTISKELEHCSKSLAIIQSQRANSDLTVSELDLEIRLLSYTMIALNIEKKLSRLKPAKFPLPKGKTMTEVLNSIDANKAFTEFKSLDNKTYVPCSVYEDYVARMNEAQQQYDNTRDALITKMHRIRVTSSALMQRIELDDVAKGAKKAAKP